MADRAGLAAVVAAVALASASGSPAPAEIAWREDYYNPAPVEGDLVLPMPCGGAIVFRRVETDSPDGAIGDVDMTIGVEGDAQPYLNGLRKSHVSGAFVDPAGAPGNAFFYMGKYELAAAQYAAVMADECPPAPRRRDFLPASGLSKLEFETFAERYTLWLLREASGALPTAGDTTGFVRLPTEDEWEYAARGGAAVEPVEFRATLPPMGEGADPSEYIAHGGADSAGGTVQAIGTLKPNPLGLHDMLGNVAEFVETPFSLVRYGRLHGRSGGWLKRGGDARTPLAGVGSATRFEVSPFDTTSATPTRDRYTGARIAIGGLTITSTAQVAELSAALEHLAAVDVALPSAASEDDVLKLLAALETDASTPGQRAQLTLIGETVKQSRAERNALRDKALRLLIESGAWMCDAAVLRYRNMISVESQLPYLAELRREAAADPDTLRQIDEAEAEGRDKIREIEASTHALATDYANLIEGLADDYSPDLLARQGDFIRAGLADTARRPQACLALIARHTEVRRTTGASEVPAIAAGFRELAEREIGEPR